MKGIFRSKYTLIVVWIVMASICVYLNLTSKSLDLSNIIVSTALFIVAFGLFFYAFLRFQAVDSMIEDLNAAADEIRDDFGNKKQYLWKYYETRENLFTDDILRKRYAEYRAEIERLEMLSGDIFRCDIEDYINQELIDDTISRNVLNLVSGTMTGLGILGTFIGLTLGLQSFNAGSASEITSSIAPLIQGIKVAFHTSIYGMVFSLIFSFIYKSKIDETTEAMDRFLNAYEHYVVPDTKNESQRQMLAFQKTLADGITEIGSSFSYVVAEKVDEIMTPQLDRMNRTIEDFAQVATRSQVEGINAVVDKFLREMNRALDGAFTELGNSIHETVKWERENRAYMDRILKDMGPMTQDLTRAGESLHETMANMASYVEWMNRINDSLNGSLAAVQAEMKALTETAAAEQKYMEQYVEYTRLISASSENFNNEMAKQTSYIQDLSGKMTEFSKKNLDAVFASAEAANKKLAESAGAANDTILRSAKESSEQIAKASKDHIYGMRRSADSVNRALNDNTQALMKAADSMNSQVIRTLDATLDAYDKSLKRIIGQLNATAGRIEKTTDKVPQTVAEAYETMQKSFDLMRRETAAMVRSMDQLRRDLKEQAGR